MSSIHAYIASITSHLSEATRDAIQLSDTTQRLLEKVLNNDLSLGEDLNTLDNTELTSVFIELEKVTNLVHGITHPEDIDHPENHLHDLDGVTLESIGKIGIIQDRVIIILNTRETPIL